MVDRIYPKEQVFLDENTTMPFLRVDPENVPYTNHLFRAADIIPMEEVVEYLTLKGFNTYLGGSAIYNGIFRGKRRTYSDIDFLAVHWDPNHDFDSTVQEFIDNAGIFEETLKRYGLPFSDERVERARKRMQIGGTSFSVERDLGGTYVGTDVDDRFILRPRVKGLKRLLGKPSDIDLSFERRER